MNGHLRKKPVAFWRAKRTTILAARLPAHFEDLNANKPFIRNVYRSISREKVENYLYRITYDLLIHVINEKAKGMNVRDEDKKFLANFYKYAFVGLVLDWIKHDMKDDPNIIVADLSVAIHGSVSAALERYRNA